MIVNLFAFVGSGISLLLGIRAIRGDNDKLAISFFITSLLLFSAG